MPVETLIDPRTGQIFDKSFLPTDILPTTKFLATVIPAFDVNNQRTLAAWRGQSHINGSNVEIYIERDKPEYLGTEGFVTRLLLSNNGRKEYWKMSEFSSSIVFDRRVIEVESILGVSADSTFGPLIASRNTRLGLPSVRILEREPEFCKPSDFPVRRATEVTSIAYSLGFHNHEGTLSWVNNLKNAILNAHTGSSSQLDWSEDTNLLYVYRRTSPYHWS